MLMFDESKENSNNDIFDFEQTKNYMLSLLPSIPNHITEEWLIETLKNELFKNWGFTFSDLSNCTFGNISEEILRKISISSYTKLSYSHPFNLDYSSYIDRDIQDLHNQGITGTGVNVAVIDQSFSIVHDEIKECLKDCKNYNNGDSHHGVVVTSNLAGRSFGVAPNANIHFYGFRGGKEESICIDTIEALKDIYNKNLNGANIKVVSISGYAHTLSSEFEDIREKLKSQGCNIIDSPTFGMGLTSINQININGNPKYYYSQWQETTPEILEKWKTKIAVPFTNISPLWNTEHDYQIGGDTTYSWVIPRLSGMYALCLQLKPEMTLDELAQLIIETKTITEDGITLINPKGMIERLTLELEEQKNCKLDICNLNDTYDIYF